MKVKVLVDTITFWGPTRLTRGQETELPQDVAEALISSGHVEAVVETQAAPGPQQTKPQKGGKERK